MRQTDYTAATRHKYRVVSKGPYVPGVTTCLDILDKPQMRWSASGIAAEAIILNWRKKKKIIAEHRQYLESAKGSTSSATLKRELGRFGTDEEVFAHWGRGEFDRQWRKKADTGTRVHTIAEAWGRGMKTSVSPEDAGYVDALEAFHRDYTPGFVLVECILLDPYLLIGGRSDGIAALHGPEAEGTFMIDYKTGREWWTVALQFVGYMDSKLAVYDEKGWLSELVDLPPLDGARAIYLRDDGTYSVVDPFAKIPREVSRRAFHACVELYKANKAVEEMLKLSELEEEDD